MITSGAANQTLRTQSRHIFQAAIEAVDPETAVRRHVVRTGGFLQIGAHRLKLDDFERILIVGAGKASAPMAKAIEDLLSDLVTEGAIVVKDGHGLELTHTTVFEASHPVPDRRGVTGS